MKEVEAKTQSVYQENAKQYDKERGKGLLEKKYLDLFLQELPKTRKVLDLGCGTGEPIAKYLIENNCEIHGADYAESMLEICREKFPSHQWFFADMRNLELKQLYAGIISWGAFFHLNKNQQRECLPMLCRHLEKGGVLMVTVGHENGEVTGTVAGQPVYHSSLSKDEYTQILESNKMEIILFNLQDSECGGLSVFLAKRT